MENYSSGNKVASPTGPARWRSTRTTPTPASSSPGPALQASHARALVDVFHLMADEYPPALPWSANLYRAMFGVPALSTARRPDLRAAHDQAHLALVSHEIGRLLADCPRVVLTALVEGITATMPTTAP